MNAGRRIVLASSSPRRRELMTQLGYPFDVCIADVDEQPRRAETPQQAAKQIALHKAQVVGSKNPDTVVVGADTIVVYEGLILGKPASSAEAVNILRRLRGQVHMVITGLAVVDSADGHESVDAVVTSVELRNYGDEEIEKYVASGDAMDKAGAYAVQSQIFHPARAIAGCYLNVVGLPLCRLRQRLCDLGLPLPARSPSQLAAICPSCLALFARRCT